LLAGAWFADGFLAFSKGHAAESRRSMETAITLLRPLGDIARLAPAYGFAGLGALNSGDLEAGVAYGREALALAQQAEDRWMEAVQHISFGLARAWDADGAHSVAPNWEEGMAIMRELNDSWGEAMGHNLAGNLLLRSGDLAAARWHFEQAMPLFEEAVYIFMANISRSGLADIARLQGDYARALELYPAVIQVWRLADHRGAIARCLECLGFIAGLQAAEAAEPLALRRRAATLYGAAEAIRQANNAPMSPWEVSEYEGHVQALRERLEPAVLAAAWQAGQRVGLDQAMALAV
jgi:tetratricopeptide (TPR) repeat protein